MTVFLLLLALLLLLILSVYAFLQHPKFGRTPAGDRLARIRRSPNFRAGQFQNLSDTPQLVEGYRMTGVLYAFLFKRTALRTPKHPIPSIRTDLKTLPRDRDLLVWFGHSSYLLQLEGRTFLVDPVFCSNASPLPGTNKAFPGADAYRAADLPAIDYLLITHDHYDHLDHETITALQYKVGTVVTGLGVGGHLERWGYEPEKIIEKDWNEEVPLGDGLVLHTTPARHFTGRQFRRNNTLWLSFVLRSPKRNLYLGGDSGYDHFFADIGRRFGPFDLAILDNGQYNDAWRYIHMHPEDVLQAARDLQARRLFPAHNSKFAMANHDWHEPLRRITELNQKDPIPLVTPRIGEVVYLDELDPEFSPWWSGVD